MENTVFETLIVQDRFHAECEYSVVKMHYFRSFFKKKQKTANKLIADQSGWFGSPASLALL